MLFSLVLQRMVVQIDKQLNAPLDVSKVFPIVVIFEMLILCDNEDVKHCGQSRWDALYVLFGFSTGERKERSAVIMSSGQC
jgi:hypothetical protein